MDILDDKKLGSGIESVDIDRIMEELERRKGDDSRIVTSIVPEGYLNMNRQRSRPVNHPSWNGRLEAEAIDTREDETDRFMCGR